MGTWPLRIRNVRVALVGVVGKLVRVHLNPVVVKTDSGSCIAPNPTLKETTGGEFRVCRASIRYIDLL